MLRFFLGALTAVAVMLAARKADAQTFPEEPAILEYERLAGAESCPDEGYFRDLVEIQRHGREEEFLPPDPYDEESVVVRVTLDRAGGKFRGTVTHLPPPGTPADPPKVLVNSECEDLLRDLAFPASFYLPFVRHHPICPDDPPPAPPGSPPANGTPASLPAPANGRPVTCPDCLPAAGAAPPACDPGREGDPRNDRACKALLARLDSVYGRPVNPSFWLAGGPLLTLLYTSDPGPGLFLSGILQGNHWSVALETQVTLPAPVRVDTSTGPADFDRSSVVGLLVPCGRVGERVRFVGCAVLGGGAIIGYDAQAPTLSTFVVETMRVGPRAGVEMLLGDLERPRVSLFAMVDLGFAPILHPTDYNGETVEVQNVASLFLSVGVSFRLTD